MRQTEWKACHPFYGLPKSPDTIQKPRSSPRVFSLVCRVPI